MAQLFPFTEYFSDAPQPLFAPDAPFEAAMERARGCFRHLRTLFQELEECRAFELLKGQADRVNYLSTKQVGHSALHRVPACTRLVVLRLPTCCLMSCRPLRSRPHCRLMRLYQIITALVLTVPQHPCTVCVFLRSAPQAKIVAMTCTHAALKRREFLELAFKYDNLLMEEAAQILEIETFIPMLLQASPPDHPTAARIAASPIASLMRASP